MTAVTPDYACAYTSNIPDLLLQ